MLGLYYNTPSDWASRALAQPENLLLDHLFCEKKAAAMALHTLRVFGQRFPVLKNLMTGLAQEEFEHAEQCQKLLSSFSRAPQPQTDWSRYAQGLRKHCNVRGRDNFIDMLLVCSLIEARSAERFKLLADCARGSTLGHFYEDLYASEVNHYTLFVGMSTDFFGEEITQKRLHELRVAAADLIRSLPAGPYVHSGPGTGQ